ncbi:caspase family protein [Baaleninema sp.]|uniref:caspase family protein n=1 Tax=Baaleninema sp. TaxID=3101197 RepID=UPI003CFD7BEB
MKRRGFLQYATRSIAATTAIELGLSLFGRDAARVLAQNAPRKLALLVGIDRYPESATGSEDGLFGCKTDVNLQRNVLIHRFGFAPEDILTLTDDKATVDGMITAFQRHLIDRAQPSDVVLFHFSGYGSQVQMSPDSEAVRNSLVAADEREADLPLTTLAVLLRSLATKKVVTVLDTSYSYPGTPLQGSLRVRSRPSPTVAQLSPGQRERLAKLRDRLDKNKSTIDRVPGVVLTAAGDQQTATENRWQGFSAGTFTYALTQRFWWATPDIPLGTTLRRVSQTVDRLAGRDQQPRLCNGSLLDCTSPNADSNPSLLIPKLTAVTADGVVLSVDGNNANVSVWLGGLPGEVLERYSPQSLLSVVPAPGDANRTPLTLQVRSRDGLTAKAQLVDASDADFSRLKPGQLVREDLRVISRNLGLTVALDPKLERIERVDATSAFSGIRSVSSVVAGEQPADCLFGRVRRATIAQTYSTETIDLPSDRGSYGLFTIGRELIPNSIGEEDEAIKKSVQRLVPQLHTLLAAKLMALTANQGSSQIGVRGSLLVFDEDGNSTTPRYVVSKQTQRGQRSSSGQATAKSTVEGVLEIPAGSRLRYQLQNLGDRPLYYLLFGLDSSGRTVAFYPFHTVSNANPPTLQQDPLMPGETVTLPAGSENVSWEVGRPIGPVKMQLLCCDRPFALALGLLAARTHPARNPRDLSTLDTPLDIAKAILQDLHVASLRNTQDEEVSTDFYALDTRVWATLDFAYRVV